MARTQFGIPSFSSVRMARPAYLPGGGGFGSMFEGDPQTKGPGKSISTQHMGTVVGKRGAGNSTITGGDPGAHSVNHYGKKGLPGMEGGSL
jgi:hypothetical protein